MNHSEQINELAAALAKAQAKMTGAKKDSENPHFRSRYADLASVRDACLPALNAEGIFVLQSPRFVGGEFSMVEVETRLIHTTGQWIGDTLSVPVTKVDAQGVGSALTYARRYALAAFAGVAPEDDDGNAAVGNGHANGKAKQEPPKPKGYSEWLDDLKASADNGVDQLKDAWTDSPKDLRAYLLATSPEQWEAIKAKAAKVQAVSA